jgi:hypothetical protein
MDRHRFLVVNNSSGLELYSDIMFKTVAEFELYLTQTLIRELQKKFGSLIKCSNVDVLVFRLIISFPLDVVLNTIIKILITVIWEFIYQNKWYWYNLQCTRGTELVYYHRSMFIGISWINQKFYGYNLLGTILQSIRDDTYRTCNAKAVADNHLILQEYIYSFNKLKMSSQPNDKVPVKAPKRLTINNADDMKKHFDSLGDFVRVSDQFIAGKNLTGSYYNTYVEFKQDDVIYTNVHITNCVIGSPPFENKDYGIRFIYLGIPIDIYNVITRRIQRRPLNLVPKGKVNFADDDYHWINVSNPLKSYVAIINGEIRPNHENTIRNMGTCVVNCDMSFNIKHHVKSMTKEVPDGADVTMEIKVERMLLSYAIPPERSIRPRPIDSIRKPVLVTSRRDNVTDEYTLKLYELESNVQKMNI